MRVESTFTVDASELMFATSVIDPDRTTEAAISPEARASIKTAPMKSFEVN